MEPVAQPTTMLRDTEACDVSEHLDSILKMIAARDRVLNQLYWGTATAAFALVAPTTAFALPSKLVPSDKFEVAAVVGFFAGSLTYVPMALTSGWEGAGRKVAEWLPEDSSWAPICDVQKAIFSYADQAVCRELAAEDLLEHAENQRWYDIHRFCEVKRLLKECLRECRERPLDPAKAAEIKGAIAVARKAIEEHSTIRPTAA